MSMDVHSDRNNDIDGYQWVSVDIGGYRWISVDIGGYRWISVIIDGYQWTSVGIARYWWMPVDNSVQQYIVARLILCFPSFYRSIVCFITHPCTGSVIPDDVMYSSPPIISAGGRIRGQDYFSPLQSPALVPTLQIQLQ